jgi:hypothetical protein
MVLSFGKKIVVNPLYLKRLRDRHPPGSLQAGDDDELNL